jgi:hypothetical protein
MSNSFKSTSRFASLLEDKPDNSINNKNNNRTKNDNSSKQELNKQDKEPSGNIFKRETNANSNFDQSSRHNHSRNRTHNRNYDSKLPAILQKKEVIPEINLEKEQELNKNMFPDLVEKIDISEKITCDTTKADNIVPEFKNTLLKSLEKPLNEVKIVKKGWVEITGNPDNMGKIEYRYGSKNQYLDYEDELRDIYDNNISLFFNKAIDKMKIRWDKYKEEYNEIYGEGSYEDLYYSSPVYGSEYDSNSDTMENDEHNDYDDNNEYYD